MLRQILAGEPDVALTAYAFPAPASTQRLHRQPPDMVILSSSRPEDDERLEGLLYSAPRSRVLALTTDARRSCLHELRRHRTAFGELSAEVLLRAVRDSGRGRSTG